MIAPSETGNYTVIDDDGREVGHVELTDDQFRHYLAMAGTPEATDSVELQAFQAWMKKVNAYVEAACGAGTDDLTDQCYGDWFEAGMSPKAAAKRAIRCEMHGDCE